MASVALLALAQDHFNETGKMKNLISKRKSAHQPEPIPQIIAIAVGLEPGQQPSAQGVEIPSRVLT